MSMWAYHMAQYMFFDYFYNLFHFATTFVDAQFNALNLNFAILVKNMGLRLNEH